MPADQRGDPRSDVPEPVKDDPARTGRGRRASRKSARTVPGTMWRQGLRIPGKGRWTALASGFRLNSCGVASCA